MNPTFKNMLCGRSGIRVGEEKFVEVECMCMPRTSVFVKENVIDVWRDNGTGASVTLAETRKHNYILVGIQIKVEPGRLVECASDACSANVLYTVYEFALVGLRSMGVLKNGSSGPAEMVKES